MSGGGMARAVRGWALPVLALALIAAVLLAARARFRREFPELRLRDGVLDLRDVDIGGDVYHVVNNWDYYPGRLYTPQDFRDPAVAASKSDGPLDPVKGTWRMRMLAQPDIYLTLCSYTIDYSTRVFVDGRVVRSYGVVSDDPKEAVPGERYMDLPLYTGADGEIEIVYQYSNYMHNDGGFIQKTLLSTPENIYEYERGIRLYSLLLSCGLLFLMFYFLLCACVQRNREYGALALCCLVIAMRNQFFFSEHVLGPDLDLITVYRLVVLDVSWIPASGLFLLAAFYPEAFGKRTVLLFTLVYAVLSALHFILGSRSMVLLCHICYYSCVPFLLRACYGLIRYFGKARRPGVMDGLTLAAIFFFGAMLIREGLLTGSDSTVNRFGLTPMTMVICILLLAVVIGDRVKKQQLQLREARQSNAILSQVNSMNRDFLRTVAHELKTPLTVISGYAQLIGRQMERGQVSDKTPERLKAIHSEADRLGEMVTRLMDYTYGEVRGAEMGAVDLDELFGRAEAVLSPVCARRRNALILRNGCTGSVHGSFELLLQVLINLVVNASRHTEAGTVTVEAEDEGRFAAVTVSDTGTGIAPEAVPHIFEKGFTTDEGRGLGLSICLETVGMHGGTLELRSTGPTGTVFRFTVPKEDAR